MQKENHNIALAQPQWIEIVRDFSKDMILLGWKVNIELFPNQESLVAFIHDMFLKDRSMLVELLYRMNISENEMGQALTNANKDNFAGIYCQKIIERSVQRIELRKRFSS